MKNAMAEIGKKWLHWAVNNPRKFFSYSMIFLSLSLVGSLIQGIFFPDGSNFSIKPPHLYSQRDFSERAEENREKEMAEIISELQLLKIKRDQNQLKKKDSLRVEYLYNQYQELKNGH